MLDQMPLLSIGARDHVVLFYGQDDELVAPVGAFLAEAIGKAGTAIVVATATRREAFASRLAQLGIDVVSARAGGAYTELDAAEMIDRFVVGDWADPARFWQEFSPVLRTAAAGAGPVRLYGEMVSVLWDRNLAGAAIEVEAMWNELGAQYPFALACGYRTPDVADDGTLDAVSQICRAHSVIVGDPPPAMRGWRY